MDEKKPVKNIREVPMTYDDFASIDDGNRYELSNGALEFLASPTSIHQLVSHQLSYLLESTCGSDYFILEAPIDVILQNNEVRQPDLVAIHRSRLSIMTKRGIEGAPDLVVEVISPSSIKRDRGIKMEVYARHCVEEYWIVDPSFQVLEQYVLNDGRYRLAEVYNGGETVHSEKIPCAAFSMDVVFRDISDLPK